jgi:hypothetical protein
VEMASEMVIGKEGEMGEEDETEIRDIDRRGDGDK